jgi:hypothetical protein
MENIEGSPRAYENTDWQNVRHSKNIFISKIIHFSRDLVNYRRKNIDFNRRYPTLERSHRGK